MLSIKQIPNGFKCSYKNLDCELLNHVLPEFGMEVVYSEQEIFNNFGKNLAKINGVVKLRESGTNYQLTDGMFADLLK
jgi:hypothetical protein